MAFAMNLFAHGISAVALFRNDSFVYLFEDNPFLSLLIIFMAVIKIRKFKIFFLYQSVLCDNFVFLVSDPNTNPDNVTSVSLMKSQ